MKTDFKSLDCSITYISISFYDFTYHTNPSRRSSPESMGAELRFFLLNNIYNDTSEFGDHECDGFVCIFITRNICENDDMSASSVLSFVLAFLYIKMITSEQTI